MRDRPLNPGAASPSNKLQFDISRRKQRAIGWTDRLDCLQYGNNLDYNIAELHDFLQDLLSRQSLILRTPNEQRHGRWLPIASIAVISTPISRLRKILEAVHEKTVAVCRIFVGVIA